MNDKKKYYIRGLGFGILITVVIITAKNNITKKNTMSDAEICARAEQLGYVLATDVNLVPTGLIDLDALKEQISSGTTEAVKPTDTPDATTVPVATATNIPTPTDTPIPTATNTPAPTNTLAPTPTNTPKPTETPKPTSTQAPEEEYDESKVYIATITVKRGMTASEVCKMCQNEKIVKNADALIRYVQSQKMQDDFLIGEFELRSDMSFAEIVEKLTGKKVKY